MWTAIRALPSCSRKLNPSEYVLRLSFFDSVCPRPSVCHFVHVVIADLEAVWMKSRIMPFLPHVLLAETS